jgi:hypothetical protein
MTAEDPRLGGSDVENTGFVELVRNSVAVLLALRKEVAVDVALAGAALHDRWRRLAGSSRAATRETYCASRGSPSPSCSRSS